MRGMKGVTVGFDLDDCIVPWYDAAHRVSVEAGLAPPEPSPRTWTPWQDYNVPKQAWIDVMNAASLDGLIYQEPPFEGVLDAMNKLACNLPGWDIRIMIVTARGFWAHGDAVREHTYAQLKAFDIPGSVVFSQDKTVVRPMEFFVDDNLKNYDMLETAGTKAFLVNRPWNQLDGPDDRRRVVGVPQYVKLVIDELMGR